MDCFHDFCLACDKQCVDTPYCSQNCRLADLENANKSTSPSPTSHSVPWSSSVLDRMTAEALQVAAKGRSTTLQQPRLTPSSSRSSLTSTSSLSGTVMTGLSGTGLTEQARLALQEYFSSFDQTRAAKRRSSTR